MHLVLMVYFLLTLKRCISVEMEFKRLSNTIVYKHQNCNTSLVWLAAPESSFKHLESHASACENLNKPADEMVKFDFPRVALIENYSNRGRLAKAADLDLFLKLGSLRRLSNNESKFFLLNNQLGTYQLMAMILDSRNLRINLINPRAKNGVLRPIHVLCLFNDCQLPVSSMLEQKHNIPCAQGPEDFINELKRNSVRLTVYQALSLLLGFLCVTFILICVTVCVYIYKVKPTKAPNHLNSKQYNDHFDKLTQNYAQKCSKLENFHGSSIGDSSKGPALTQYQASFDDKLQLKHPTLVPRQRQRSLTLQASKNQPNTSYVCRSQFPMSKSMQFPGKPMDSDTDNYLLPGKSYASSNFKRILHTPGNNVIALKSNEGIGGNSTTSFLSASTTAPLSRDSYRLSGKEYLSNW